jgi:PadR family transcriptional regulator
VRRKPGQLLPLETAICVCAANLRRRGTNEFHGSEIAKRLGDENNRRLLTAYGTLYRALGRLEAMGLRENAAQEAHKAAGEKRPRRAARRPEPA